jgi:hypothetical protein
VPEQARGMTTTELTGPLDAPDEVELGRPRDPSHAPRQASDAPFHARSSALEHPAHGERLGEPVALIGVPPGEGPPIILLAAPLVLFALALTGPFLLLLTLVVMLVACAVIVALAGAIVASPYLLVRRFGSHPLARTHRSAAAAQFVPVDSGRGEA